MTRIGILSDTHLNSPSPGFVKQVQQAFANCSVILHAGDLTDISILDSFADKEVHAVQGNMCGYACRQNLPTEKVITIDGHTITLCHGAGERHNIEERLWKLFPTADCMAS